MEQRVEIDHKRVINGLIIAADKLMEDLFEELKSNISTQSPPASAAGNYPHRDTGELLESLDLSKNNGTYVISASAEHAEYLEFGTSNMEPRPFLRPTMIQAQEKFKQLKVKE